MTGVVEILVVAFAAQLVVLPGEKVQIIIAALSTRSLPVIIASAAGPALAGWTALEIAFGGLLQAVLPGAALDVITAVLFLGFGVALLRTDAARVDGSTSPDAGPLDEDGALTVPRIGVTIPARCNGFLPVFAMMAVGESSDKNSARHDRSRRAVRRTPRDLGGRNARDHSCERLNASVFHRFAAGVNVRGARNAGASIFLSFGLDIVFTWLVGFSVWGSVIDAIAGAVGVTLP